MKLIKQLMFALFVGSSLLTATGCASTLGFMLGAASDSNKIKKMGTPPEQATPLRVNNRIQIFLKNGQQQEGKFQFYMKRRAGDEYLESIVWYDKATDRQVSTQVADIERIETIPNKNGKWESLEEAATIPSDSQIQIFLKDGQKQEGKFIMYLEQKVDDGYVETIVWYDKTNNRQVSTQITDIERLIAIPNPNGKKLVGVLLGGIIDAILVVGMYKAGKDIAEEFFEGLFGF